MQLQPRWEFIVILKDRKLDVNRAILNLYAASARER